MCFFIHEAVVVHMIHVSIKFINYRQSVWNLVFLDIFVRYVLYMLEKCAEGVFMGNNYYFLVVHDLSANLVVPEGGDSINGVFHRFNTWKGLLGNELVFGFVGGVSIIVYI